MADYSIRVVTLLFWLPDVFLLLRLDRLGLFTSMSGMTKLLFNPNGKLARAPLSTLLVLIAAIGVLFLANIFACYSAEIGVGTTPLTAAS